MGPRRSRAVRAAHGPGDEETPRKRHRTVGSTNTPTPRKKKAGDAAGAGSGEEPGVEQGLSSSDAYFLAQSGAVAKGSGATLSSALPPLRADALQQLFPPLPPGNVNCSAHFLRRTFDKADQLKAHGVPSSDRTSDRRRERGKIAEEQEPQAELERWPIAGSTDAGGPMSAPILSELAILASQTQHTEWNRLFSLGHAILLHGPGDTEAVLADYVRQKPPRGLGSAVLFRSYTPGTTAALMRSLLDQLEQDVLRTGGESAQVPQGPGWNSANVLVRARKVAYAYRFLPEQSDVPPLYLAISQLDSKLFRNPVALNVLSILAAAPSIFVIASASHVNTPLLFPPAAPPLLGACDFAPSNALSALDPPPVPWAYISIATFVPPLNAALYAAAAPRGGALKLPAPLSLKGASSSTASTAAIASHLFGSGNEADLPTISLARTERILTALPDRAINLFSILASLQLSQGKTPQAAEALDALKDGTMLPAPISAVLEAATNEFVARDLAGLKAMLPEFTSHGVIHSLARSAEYPEERLWIALKHQDLVAYLKSRVEQA